MLSIIFIHEFSHIIVAILYGLKVVEIELLPIGGTAKIENMQGLFPEQEILISLAGPAVNFMIVFMIRSLNFNTKIDGSLLHFFSCGNLMLGIFNLIPALPLDGGRILRGILHYFIGYKKATKILIALTRVIAVGLFIFSLCIIIEGGKNILSLFVSIFLLINSRKESKILPYISIRNILSRQEYSNLRRNQSNIRHIITDKDTKAKNIVDDFKPYNYYIVVLTDHDGKVLGCLDESSLIDGMIEYGIDVPIGKLVYIKDL